MEKARSLRNLCFRSEKRFYHTEIGYNFRLSSIQVALGVAQVERIEKFVKIKKEIAHYYNENFKSIGALFLLKKNGLKTFTGCMRWYYPMISKWMLKNFPYVLKNKI